MNISFPGQYRGSERAQVIQTAWRWEAHDLAAGGYTHVHLQAAAVTPHGNDTGDPAAVDVTLMWSGSFPLTGWGDRRLVAVRAFYSSGTWIFDRSTDTISP